MKKTMAKKLVSGLLMCLPLTGQAKLVAVVDSGVDYKHQDLARFIWENKGERDDGSDTDGDGYADDRYGWNFAENNKEIIDYSLLGTFSDDVVKFFTIQQKMMLNKASFQEIMWMQNSLNKQGFSAELNLFANFVHGTHVSGITAHSTDKDTQILGIKMISAKRSKATSDEEVESQRNPFAFLKMLKEMNGWTLDETFSYLNKQLSKAQIARLSKVVAYTHKRGGKIMNGSFGTGYRQIVKVMKLAYVALEGEVDAAKVKQYSINFLQHLVDEGVKMASNYPDMLFVFAAGNDSLDNDTYPSYPANLSSLPNVLSVAATFKGHKWAKFSNYGATTVSLAAPGVAINSTIPGDDYMMFSGTSQATPLVSAYASDVWESNPKLTPAQVKDILMGTVTKADYLEGRSVSNGRANKERAVRAAELSQDMDLSEAIALANEQVGDEDALLEEGAESFRALDSMNLYEGYIVPLKDLLGQTPEDMLREAL